MILCSRVFHFFFSLSSLYISCGDGSGRGKSLKRAALGALGFFLLLLPDNQIVICFSLLPGQEMLRGGGHETPLRYILYAHIYVFHRASNR